MLKDELGECREAVFFVLSGKPKKISKARLNEEKDNGTVHMRCIEVTEAIMQGAREDRGGRTRDRRGC